jgi:hypothetical protein
MGIIGGNYGENATLVMAHTNDIAAVAAEEMLYPTFTGKSVRYIASDEVATQDIARTLGAAIGLPNLPWVNFTDADTIGGMVAAGLSQEVASNYAEMGSAMASGQMAADYLLNKPALSPTKLAQFAQEFAAIYNAG